MSPLEQIRAVARAWLSKAEGDLEAARLCVQSERVPPWIAGFHLQQAAEKSLKGLLVLADVEPPRTHDLAALLRELAQAGRADAVDASDLVGLQPFAIEERYPILSPMPVTRDEVALLVDAAARAVGALAKALATG